MATFGGALRRGLPRVPGGDGWPPAGDAPAGATAGVGEPAAADSSAPVAASAPASPHDAASTSASLRRGLPRTRGGEAWPPASVRASVAVAASATVADPTTSPEAGTTGSVGVASTETPPATGPETTPAPATGGATLRRGLPRARGAEPWPPAGTVAMLGPGVVRASSLPARQEDVAPVRESAARTTDAAVAQDAGTTALAAAAAVDTGPRAPLPFTSSVWPGRSAPHRPQQRPEPERIGPFTKLQWAGAAAVGGIALLFAAGMAVALVRFVLSLDAMQDFLVTYPGEYHLPEGAPVGIPAWLGWQHFFNVFLMVLIIRTGLTIRREKRPTVFWTPRRDPKGKTSLTIWFHQSLDLLWVVNGVVFVVLLFVTGQWMRIVPTSWEVFPNAVSAALQYVSLDWPTENGWVNYNSLQQLAYFSTVFLAAPLAVATGIRMSGLWPKSNARLKAAYPVEWARTVHFPVMLYFVVFIVIHVLLVFATGALRNLNHMYAAQGSVDGVAYADNWAGFWMFALSLVVIAGAWVAARPLVLAPIARLFGTVSGR